MTSGVLWISETFAPYCGLRRTSNWRARDALALIAARGYHRGRNLMAEFDDLLSPPD